MTDQFMQADDYRAWKSWSAEAFGRSNSADAAAFHREMELSGVPMTGSVALLEIGFGNGQFAMWAKSRGWQVVGTELDAELVARANAAGIEAHGSDTPLERVADGRRFDVIVAFDVFEHLTLDELRLLLRSARTCLKPGGRIVARFPSGDSPFARSVQHSDMTHKLAIGSGFVRQLAQQTGFRAPQIRSPAFPIRGVGMVRGLRRLAVLSLRKSIAAAINMAFHDGQSLVVSRNMLVVLEPL